jgi:hypothetical protein
MSVHQKLIAVRKAIPAVQKDGRNAYHGFNYASSSAVLYSVRSLLDEHGLLLVPEMLNGKSTPHETSGGKRHLLTEVNMRYTWVDVDNPSDKVECLWYGQGVDDAEKGVGKAATYAEKYFLLKFFNIPTDADDPDSTRSSQSTADVKALAPAPDSGFGVKSELRSEIRRLAGNRRVPDEAASQALRIADGANLTEKMANNVISRLREIITNG